MELVYISGNTYYFYLRDHLGNNARVVRADGVTQQSSFFRPYGKSAGVDSWGQGFQPYKFGGKEEETMLGLNQYDFGSRILDNSYNAFTTQDRFAEKYPWQSPYAYAANNPVNFIDVNGDSINIVHNIGFLGLGGQETLRYEDENLYNKDGSAYTGKVKGFLNKTVQALNTIGTLESGDKMLNELQSSTDNFSVEKTFGGNSYNTVKNTIKFNPSSREGGLNIRGTTDRPSFIGLAHELAHALDDSRGTINLNTIPGQVFTYAEHFSTHLENQIRAEHLLPLRTHYGVDATGAGIYPIINSGSSIHYSGYNYYNAIKIKTPLPLLNIK